MIHLLNTVITVIRYFFLLYLTFILIKYFKSTGTAFTVLWENVKLQDKDVGTFTFSVTLYKSGNIVYAYYSVPIHIESIQDDKHPVKVGLSDAYIIDKTIFCKFILRIII